MSIKFCKKCLFPETKPDLYFNDEGICDSCISASRIHGISNSIDWNERKKNFESIVKEYRGGDKYNCIVPVSGGKDRLNYYTSLSQTQGTILTQQQIINLHSEKT